MFFFTFDKQPLPNGVSNYQLKKEDFGRNGRSYSARKVDQVGRQFAVDEESGKLLKLRDILKNEPDSLRQLKNTMQNHIMASQKIPLDKIGILGGAVYPSDLDDTNFQIDEENLILPVRIPGYRQINQVILPLSSLANQLNTRFLPADVVPTVHKPIKGKKIALTFDDGPSYTTTPEILATLKKYNAKATFFVLGKEVLANPGIVKKEKEAGHQIANHSFDHKMLTKISKQEVAEQILKTQMAVYHEINEFPEMVRPPYGAINKEVSNQMAIPVAQWSVDTEDWKYRNEKHITGEVVKDAYDGAIILMHDIHPKTAKSLDGTLKKLKAEGYQFVTVNELLNSAPTIGNQYFDEDDKRLIN
ncbi:polysaccharide deacetylase family protein [Listeria fleischmannii]|uniref:polysaccharide deacetylase family protein n=1 Tax=Listeria fleischmannii TaxID=1069827 RepID=UPI0002BAB5CC|nr:polysaccharide deacetylase family protein [Listeria fleischmannii]EMG29364.1 putative endo-1,4-beta-xylanase [Listeria fleischmannii subsp. fleischmannii LU2006-1]